MFDIRKLVSLSVDPTETMVNMVAHIILLINGSMTSLDVKNVLRSMNFTISQDEAGKYVRAFYERNSKCINMQDNGTYRTYTFKPEFKESFLKQFSEWNLLKDSKSVEVSGTGKFIQSNNSNNSNTITASKGNRLWVVYDGRIKDKIKNYKSITASTRDEARKIYSSKYGVPYFSVRARIHGNPARI